MMVTISTNLFRMHKQWIRNFCGKSLVLKKRSRRKCSAKSQLKDDVNEKFLKEKPKVTEKNSLDYCEETWLANLTTQNLKLFRRTPSGSFRKINLDNLFEKLKEIHPIFQEINAKNELASGSKSKILGNSEEIYSGNANSSWIKNVCNEESQLAPPQMSEYLVKHMLEFPLLKMNFSNSLLSVVQDEVEEFGVMDSINFPSVTKILNATMSDLAREKLGKWKKVMLKELGTKMYDQYLEDIMRQGKKFHTCLKCYLMAKEKESVEVDPEIRGCWDSLSNLLPDISNVKMVEEHVHHPVLMYKGMVDCVATYKDVPCVIEWKKSDKMKSDLSSTHDAPLQLCAYLGALSWQKSFVQETKGLIVVAYTSGSPANVLPMDTECCQFYWMEWLRRLRTYWMNNSSVHVRKEADA